MRLIGFPNPVNEKAARAVAAGVLIIAGTALVSGWLWLTLPLALGFLARVATGPKLSPLGQLATRVIAPRLGPPKLVAGPPKRFAQAIGTIVTASSAVAWFGFGSALAAGVLLAMIIVAAGLEAIFAICLGCIGFAYLMRAGVIPEETCKACGDISSRYSRATAGARLER